MYTHGDIHFFILKIHIKVVVSKKDRQKYLPDIVGCVKK